MLLGEEPLLKVSKRQFMLFLIEYNEVSHTSMSQSCRVDTEAHP